MDKKELTESDRVCIATFIDRNLSQVAEEIFKKLPLRFSRQTIHDLVIETYGYIAGDQAERILGHYRLYKDREIRRVDDGGLLIGAIYQRVSR